MASRTVFKYSRVKEELNKIDRKLVVDITVKSKKEKSLCVVYKDVIEFRTILLSAIIRKYNLKDCKETTYYNKEAN